MKSEKKILVFDWNVVFTFPNEKTRLGFARKGVRNRMFALKYDGWKFNILVPNTGYKLGSVFYRRHYQIYNLPAAKIIKMLPTKKCVYLHFKWFCLFKASWRKMWRQLSKTLKLKFTDKYFVNIKQFFRRKYESILQKWEANIEK